MTVPATTNREINWRQFISALRADGYSQATGSLIKTDNAYTGKQKITSACAGGQMGLNLGVGGDSLLRALRNFKLENGSSIGSFIMDANDNKRLPLRDIADALESAKVKGGRRRVRFTLPTVNYAEKYSNYKGVVIPD